MLGRDRAQHGREKQHREDGGTNLHHGTGQTVSSCSAGDLLLFVFASASTRTRPIAVLVYDVTPFAKHLHLISIWNNVLRSLAFLSFRTFVRYEDVAGLSLCAVACSTC